MLRVQELCGLRICWLERGQICFESMLGLNEHAPATVVARYERTRLPLWRCLDREALLTEMLCGNQKYMPRCWARDRLVEVLTPVTLFEFEAIETKDSRLAPALNEQGAANLFGEHLNELARMGQALRDRGQGHDRGRWGVCVYFHTLWLFPAALQNTASLATPQLAGQVDLYRLPLAMFAERPPEAAEPDVEVDVTISVGSLMYRHSSRERGRSRL